MAQFQYVLSQHVTETVRTMLALAWSLIQSHVVHWCMSLWGLHLAALDHAVHTDPCDRFKVAWNHTAAPRSGSAVQWG